MPFAVLFVLMMSVPVCADGKNGLVGYWSFDEGQGQTVRDASGRNHHGRIKGGAKWVQGRQGAALEFNGANSMVEIANPEGLNIAGEMTFMAWLKTSADDARDRLIFGDTAGLAVNRNVSIELDRGGLYVGHGNGARCESFSPSLKFDGTWKHLAIIFEQSRYYLYVDGALHKYGELGMSLSRTPGGGRCIGGWWAGHFQGTLDEVRLYDRALSEREVLEQARASVPPAERAARLSLTPRLKLGVWGFDALFTQLVVKDGRVECTLTRRGETQLLRVFSAPLQATGPETERAFAQATLPGELSPGAYVLTATARNAKGNTLAVAREEVTIADRPAWFGSKAGVTDAVLSPYTPVEVIAERGEVVLGVWGRTYQLGPHPLPEQIVSRRAALLNGPVRLRAVVEGKEVSWSEAPPTIRRRTPARVALEQNASAGALSLQCVYSIEYDGLLRTDCTFSSGSPVTIQSLVLEVPLKKEYARYLHAWSSASFGGGVYSGQINRPMEFAFRPILWVGDEARGLSWLCESENQWAPDDPAKVIQVVPSDKQTMVRVRIIGKPTVLHPDQPFKYSFAFQATPLKPMGKDGWELRFGGSPWYGYDYDLFKGREFRGKPGLVRLKELGVRTLIAWNWTPALAYPWPLERAADFKVLVRACHAQGIRVIPYLGYQISEKAPEFSSVRDEVVVFPRATNPDKYPGMEPQMVSSVCLRSVWQDALADYVSRMMDEFDIDGVYLDSTNTPFPCTNALHGCEARRADGTIVPVYPVFAVRDTFRRLYAVVKARKPDGIVDSHVYDCMNSGALAFSTSYWNGEQLSPADVPTYSLPLDRFRTEFTGANWGVPCDLLSYKLGSFRKAMAVSLPHDVLVRDREDDFPVRPWQDEFSLSQAVWRLTEDFGRSEARFTPYWDRDCPLHGLPKDWIASVYRHPRNGALVIVSNLSRRQGHALLKVNRKALGIDDAAGPVVDGLTRETLPLKAGTIEIALPAAGWQYIWVQRAK